MYDGWRVKNVFVLINIFRSKHDELFEEFESTRDNDILQPDVLQQVIIISSFIKKNKLYLFSTKNNIRILVFA